MSEEAKGSNKFSDEESQMKVKSKRRESERKTRRREKKCDCQLRRTNNIGVSLCACIHILPVCVLLEFSAAMAERWGRLPWWPLNRAPKYSHVQLTPSRSPQPQRHVMYTWEGTFCCLFLSSAIQKRSTWHGNQYSVTASVSDKVLKTSDPCTLHLLPPVSDQWRHAPLNQQLLLVHTNTHGQIIQIIGHWDNRHKEVQTMQNTDARMPDYYEPQQEKAALIFILFYYISIIHRDKKTHALTCILV